MTTPRRTDLYLAAESVIDPSIRDAILARFPNQSGASVADLLDLACDSDFGLEITEPFHEEHLDDLVALVGMAHEIDGPTSIRCVGLAALTLTLAQQTLSVDGVRDLAGRIAARSRDVAA